MNKYYEKSLNTQHDRKPVFEFICSQILSLIKSPKILEIGCSRNLDVDSIFGDGWSTLYWADYILRHGGALTIVDTDPQALENCKIILSDFIGKIDLFFIVDDGNNWTSKPFDLYYLDGGDQEWQTFEMFKKIDLRNGAVLLDDFNPGGKCDRIKNCYPFFRNFQVNYLHAMGFYPKYDNYGEPSFKIGGFKLPYYRGWKGNREAVNERAVEISLSQNFLDFLSPVIEVGAVMPYYWGGKPHDYVCFDPYDSWPYCDRTDAINVDYTDKNVLSCSTLEHIGWDTGYEKKEPEKAIKVLEKITKEARNYLLVWGIGQHPILDNYIKNSKLKYHILVRENRRGLINNWAEDNNLENFNIPYLSWDLQAGYYGNAGALVVVSSIDF